MKPENENSIRRFLLGEMAGEERFEFEEQFIVDPDLFDHIEVIEGELIEKYVRGWMNPAERAKFETNFLTSAKRRERVAFSRALIGQIESKKKPDLLGESAVIASEKESYFASIRAWFRFPQLAIAGAVTIMVTVFGLWMFVRDMGTTGPEVVRQTNTQVAETPFAEKTPTISPDVSPVSSNEDPEKVVPSPSNVPANNKTPEKTPAPPIKRSPPNPVLVLFSGTLRSNGAVKILTFPENSTGATIRLRLAENNYNLYEAQITDADGKIIARYNRLKPSNSSLRFFVEAGKLPNGDYLIKLNGINKANKKESAADFQFRVQ